MSGAARTIVCDSQQDERWEGLNRWVEAAIGSRVSGEYQEAMADVKNEIRRLERGSMPYQWEPVHETAESAVCFALGLVARFEGDDQCVLNRYHSEALAYEVRRLTDELTTLKGRWECLKVWANTTSLAPMAGPGNALLDMLAEMARLEREPRPTREQYIDGLRRTTSEIAERVGKAEVKP